MEILNVLVKGATTLINRYDAVQNSDSRAKRLREHIGELRKVVQSVQHHRAIVEDEKYRRQTENLKMAFDEASKTLNDFLNTSTVHKIFMANNNKIGAAEDRLQQALRLWHFEMQLAIFSEKGEPSERSKLQQGIRYRIELKLVITAGWLLEQPYLRGFFEHYGDPGVNASSDCQHFTHTALEKRWQRYREEYKKEESLTPRGVENVRDILLCIMKHLKGSTISSLVDLKYIDNEEADQLYKILERQFPLVEMLTSSFVVLGPMNSGKSTLINALVGMEVCPSHSTASTAIPCKIRHSPQPMEPTLEIDIEPFTDAIKDIRTHATQDPKNDKTRAAEVLDHEVENAREQIVDETFPTLEPKTIGVENCHRTLKSLNQIVRLCIYYGIDLPVSTSLYPTIHVHFTGLSNVDIVGIFEIIDSPGLAEGDKTRTGQIEDIIRELIQSSTASFVILACDIIQLNATQAVTNTLINTSSNFDKTYVIGNKFDLLQTSGDFETLELRDRLRQKISDIILDRHSSIERVYLTSGSLGLLAIKFRKLLRENVRNGKQERPKINFDVKSWERRWSRYHWRTKTEQNYESEDPNELVALNKELFADSHIGDIQDLMTKKLAPDSARNALHGAADKICRQLVPVMEMCRDRATLFHLNIDQLNSRIDKNENELKIIRKCLENWRDHDFNLIQNSKVVVDNCYQELTADINRTIDDTLAPEFRQNHLDVVLVTGDNYIEQGLLESDIGHRVLQFSSKNEAKEALEKIRSNIEAALENIYAEFNIKLAEKLDQTIKSHTESLEKELKQSLNVKESMSATQIMYTIHDRAQAAFENTKSDLLRQAIAQGIKRRKHWYTFWLKEHIHKMKKKFVIRQLNLAKTFKDNCKKVIDNDTLETKTKNSDMIKNVQEMLSKKIDQRLIAVQLNLSTVRHNKEMETIEEKIKQMSSTSCLSLELEYIIEDLKHMLKFLEYRKQ